jgi:glycosyltransferase involved in cell wall biosynthesis
VKIVFLYSLLTPSVSAVLRALVTNHEAQIVVYYWDKGGNKPYDLPEITCVDYRPMSALSAKDIEQQTLRENPELIYVTAWQEPKYLRTCRSAMSLGIPVVSGFDDNWLGTVRQRVGAKLIRLIKRFHFSHAMASGPRQYHYARLFGFADKEILYYLFSADTDRFDFEAGSSVASKEDAPFIYIGRYSASKGIKTLAAGYRIYRESLEGRRNLICFGNGDEKVLLESIEGIDVREYTTHANLIKQCRISAAFVLPSVYDPSPLVVHEMTLLGMPLVLSENVGNRLMFLINGFNGFVFRASDPQDLASKLKRFDTMLPKAHATFVSNSHKLSAQHSPELVAASLVSILI